MGQEGIGGCGKAERKGLGGAGWKGLSQAGVVCRAGMLG